MSQPWLIFAAGSVLILVILTGLIIYLLKQTQSLTGKLDELTRFSANRLDDIGVAVDANLSRSSGVGTSRRHKSLLTDAERLIPIFTQVLGPAAKNDTGFARLFLAMQQHLYEHESDPEIKKALVVHAKNTLKHQLPQSGQAQDISEIMAQLENVVSLKTQDDGVHQKHIREMLEKIDSEYTDFSKITRETMNDIHSSNARMEAAIQTRFDKQQFDLKTTLPGRLSRIDETLTALDVASERHTNRLLVSIEELIQALGGSIGTDLETLSKDLSRIMHDTADSQAVADAVRGLKIYRLNEAVKQDQRDLPSLQSSPVLTLISNLESWISNIQTAYAELREPLVHGDSLSRYSAFVLNNAGLQNCLTDIDLPLIERMGLFLEQQDQKEFLRLWGNPENPMPHTTLIKIRFLLENMLCPLLQDQPEHPIFTLRENIVPFCESLTSAAKRAGVLIHHVVPHTDQTVSRWYIDPCGEDGVVSQAVLNSRIEFTEIFRNWLNSHANIGGDSNANPVIELCVVGYSLAGKGRPEVMSRASCYRDVAWQLA